MLPEWTCFPAIIDPVHVTQLGTGPSYATRFIVQLRLERKEQYYINHICLVTYLITSMALLPLALAATGNFQGDRLAVQVSGLLTLISFKYTVADSLPTVPYSTFITTFMQTATVTVVCVSIEGVVAQKLSQSSIENLDWIDMFEDALMYILFVVWSVYFFYAAFFKGRRDWQDVVDGQANNIEMSYNREEERDRDSTWTGDSAVLKSLESGVLLPPKALRGMESSSSQIIGKTSKDALRWEARLAAAVQTAPQLSKSPALTKRNGIKSAEELKSSSNAYRPNSFISL